MLMNCIVFSQIFFVQCNALQNADWSTHKHILIFFQKICWVIWSDFKTQLSSTDLPVCQSALNISRLLWTPETLEWF